MPTKVWQCKCLEDIHRSFRLFSIDSIGGIRNFLPPWWFISIH
uniref:PP2A4 n=1 Tax=Arundo donax TaxID=35708 RepID=A0A0A9EV85_ARUDO